MSITTDIYGGQVAYQAYSEPLGDQAAPPLESLPPLPTPFIDPPQAGFARTKRLIDVLVVLALLVLLLPLLALIAVLIFAGDRGPILYSQTRIGQNGRPFRFFKFRSMIVDADSAHTRLAEQNEATGPIFKMRRDPRVTPIGRVLRRTSLDELPQLFNVLKGDMSLIGPRPHRPGEVEAYLPHHYSRLSVPQGLICLREVSGRSNLSFERWMELDLEYVRKRSPGTDLRILCLAVPAVLRGDGAY